MSSTDPVTVRCRLAIERNMFSYGRFVSKNPFKLVVAVVSIQLLTIGLWFSSGKGVPMETNIAKLWVETGGRVERELAYIDEHKVKGWGREINSIIFQNKDDPSANALTSQMLQDHLTVMKAVLAITVEKEVTKSDGTKETLSFSLSGFQDGASTKYNLCDYVPFPDEIVPESYQSLVWSVTPCNRATVLDCFEEGEEDFYLKPFLGALQATDPSLIVDEYGMVGYTNRPPAFGDLPSIFSSTDEEIFETVKSGCPGYISKLVKWEISQLFGGFTMDEAGENITFASAFQYAPLLGSPKLLATKFKEENITAEMIEELQEEWAQKMETEILKLNDNGALKEAHIAVMSFGAFGRVMDEFSSANGALIGIGYGLMLAFVMLSQFSFKPAERTVLIGVLGLVLVFVGNIFGLSILVLAGVRMNATVLQVLPFLALGLGVDDLFVLLEVYKETVRSHPNLSASNTIGYVLRQGGISVTLTSTCNAAAFAIGSVIPLPAVQVFCISSFVAVVVNYLSLLISVPCLLTFKVNSTKTSKVNAVGSQKNFKELQQRTNSYADVNVGFLHGVYIPMMKRKPVRVCGCIAFLVLSGIGLALSRQVENGLRIVDVVPAGSPIHDSLSIVEEKFNINGGAVVTKNIDYGNAEVRQGLRDLMAGMERELSFVSSAKAEWIDEIESDWNETQHAIPNAKFADFMRNFTDMSKATYIPTYIHGMMSFGYDEVSGDLTYASMGFTIDGADDTELMVDALEQVREYLGTHCGAGTLVGECFPTGTIFTYYEQYVSLENNFYQAVMLCEVAIFACCVLLLMDLLVGIFVSVLSFAVLIQIYGALFIFGIKFSAIPAVSLIMSVGISVEFTAHLCTHFEAACGNRVERMSEALHHMFTPIAEGGFSSFLGFVCLAFSSFAFIQKYYFGIYFLVVCIGLLNGLFFLPCLLSFAGPVQESRSDRLQENRRKTAAVS